jgi:hypothetical protein
MSSDWKPANEAPEGVAVRTRIKDEHGVRNEQELIRRGRFWWMTDSSMYVYYTPTEYQEKTDD